MRLHISPDDDVVRTVDDRVGRRQRSMFIGAAVRRALDDERRWQDVVGAVGALVESEHDWDRGPAGWVRGQRAADARRVG